MSGVEERIVGAHIVRVDTSDAAKAILYFEHPGTDDDSGFIVAPLIAIYFTDGFDTREVPA